MNEQIYNITIYNKLFYLTNKKFLLVEIVTLYLFIYQHFTLEVP